MNINETDERPQLAVNPQYVLFITGLVLLQLGNSFLIWLSDDAGTRQIAWIFLYCISTIMLVGFFYQLIRSPHKKQNFFRHRGWMAFLGSLPVPFMAVFQFARMYLNSRTMRREDLDHMFDALAAERARSTFIGVIWVGILILETSAIGVLYYEIQSPLANIQNGSEALWWSYVTIATVGYGDYTPVTAMGRVVGILTMTVGVALFSVLTSFLTDWFRRPQRRRKVLRAPAGADLSEADVQSNLDEIYRILEEQEQAQSDALEAIRDRLRKIETRRK